MPATIYAKKGKPDVVNSMAFDISALSQTMGMGNWSCMDRMRSESGKLRGGREW